jgi:hypothetical protein
MQSSCNQQKDSKQGDLSFVLICPTMSLKSGTHFAQQNRICLYICLPIPRRFLAMLPFMCKRLALPFVLHSTGHYLIYMFVALAASHVRNDGSTQHNTWDNGVR